MSKLATYRAGRSPLPECHKVWHLYGAGLDHLRQDTQPVPAFGPQELLARVDACGLCFSDIKVIRQGGAHPRLFNRDLAHDPIVLGHEVALTIVGVGAELQHQFRVGDRFVVQADIYYKGVNLAFGYMLPGGLQQYVKLSDEVLRGDDGCYLIPIHDDTGYAEAALAEPWACVVRAYRDTRRQHIQSGGKAWIIGTREGERLNYDLGGMNPLNAPAEIVMTRCPDRFLDAIRNLAEIGGVKIIGSQDDSLAEIAARYAPEGFDDIFVLGADADVIEQAAPFLAKDGVMTIVSEKGLQRLVELDVGRIHYDALQFVATGPGRPLGGYSAPRPLKWQPEGLCWICGAGGPMGQMHVQMAVEAPDGPRLIVCTDIDSQRLSRLPVRFAEAAARRGCQLVLLNPQELGEQFEAELWKIAPEGFDDVVCLVPVPAVISQCSRFLGRRGVFNIFAGVARGTMAQMDVDRIIRYNVRYFGSSGSSIEDLQMTLSLAERGELSPNMAVAAIGGIEAVKEGLQAVSDSALPGKIVIYPHIEGLPLTPLPQLNERMPEVAAHLGPDYTWTREAEKELFERYL